MCSSDLVLRFPGVLAGQSEDPEALAKIVQELLDEALKEFAAACKREGKKLGEHLLQRLSSMEEIVDALSELFPSLFQAHMDKVNARLAEAVGNIDNDCLQQEFALKHRLSIEIPQRPSRPRPSRPDVIRPGRYALRAPEAGGRPRGVTATPQAHPRPVTGVDLGQ